MISLVFLDWGLHVQCPVIGQVFKPAFLGTLTEPGAAFIVWEVFDEQFNQSGFSVCQIIRGNIRELRLFTLLNNQCEKRSEHCGQ